MTSRKIGTRRAAALQTFHDYLAQHRRTEHRRLLNGLRSRRFATLTHDWRTR